MGVLRVEDLYGSIEVMLFPQVYARVKEVAKKDVVVKITGKISIREGEAPIILAEDITVLSDNKPLSGTAAIEESSKKLYLRYNTHDVQLHSEVQNILRSYSGNIPVTIRCTATGDVFSPRHLVRECNAIKFELENLLGTDNIHMS